jgi:hypothetical protein
MCNCKAPLHCHIILAACHLTCLAISIVLVVLGTNLELPVSCQVLNVSSIERIGARDTFKFKVEYIPWATTLPCPVGEDEIEGGDFYEISKFHKSFSINQTRQCFQKVASSECSSRIEFHVHLLLLMPGIFLLIVWVVCGWLSHVMLEDETATI